MRKEKTKKKITGLDDERGILYRNLKKLNIEKHETIGGLDLPKAENLKKKSSKIPKITTQQKWYRRRADKLSAAAAAARRSTKVGGGGAHKLSAAAARRGRRTALPPCTESLGSDDQASVDHRVL